MATAATEAVSAAVAASENGKRAIFHCFAFLNAAVLLLPSLWLSSHYGTGLAGGGLDYLLKEFFDPLVSLAPCPSCQQEVALPVSSVSCFGSASSFDGHCGTELHNQSLLELHNRNLWEHHNRQKVLCRKEVLDMRPSLPHMKWKPWCWYTPSSPPFLAPPL